MQGLAVIALGGSLLRAEEGPAHAWLKRFSELVAFRLAVGQRLAIVVGGGSPARDAIGLLRPLMDDEHRLDEVGIAATRLNATTIRELLSHHGLDVAPPIPESIGEAVDLLADDVPVLAMGGTVPGQTTDTVAVQLAVAGSALRCIIATNVNHVHDMDPFEHPEAQPLDAVSHAQLVTISAASSGSGAGARGVIDPMAARLAADHALPLDVLHGRHIDRIAASLSGSPFLGTTIRS